MKFPEYKFLNLKVMEIILFNRYLLTRDLLGTFLRINDSRRKSRDNMLLKSLDRKFSMGILTKFTVI